MAIAMALNGGMGLVHYNMLPKEQVKEVARVKRHIHGLIQDPITVAPSNLIGDLLQLIETKRYGFSTFPVVDGDGPPLRAGLRERRQGALQLEERRRGDDAALAAQDRRGGGRSEGPDKGRGQVLQRERRDQQDARGRPRGTGFGAW